VKLSVKVDGTEVVAANILKKGEKFTRAVRDEMLKQGERLETEAKQSPPTPVDTGRMRGSISTNWSGSGMARGKVDSPAKSGDGVGQPDERDKQFAVVVGTNVEYAPYVETGTSCMSARRFMFRAWAGLKTSILQEIANAGREEVAKK
jgi:HK97 gp10 family phage protein